MKRLRWSEKKRGKLGPVLPIIAVIRKKNEGKKTGLTITNYRP